VRIKVCEKVVFHDTPKSGARYALETGETRAKWRNGPWLLESVGLRVSKTPLDGELFTLYRTKISDISQKVLGYPAEINFVADRPGHDLKYELADSEAILECDFNHSRAL